MKIVSLSTKAGSATLVAAILALSIAPLGVLAEQPEDLGISGAPVQEFTASISPTTVETNSVTSYTVTITNSAISSTGIKSVSVSVPSGFSVSGGTLALSGVSNWSVILDGSNIKAKLNTGPSGISAGSSITISFNATAPATEGSLQWTTSAFSNNSYSGGGGAFSSPPSQPTVSVEEPDVPPTICSDNDDNDDDGFTDEEDPGCADASDTDESNPIITASAGANGSISPSGSVGVAEGDDQAFTITPVGGFQIDELLVDAEAVLATGVYTFTSVTANHTISVTFEAIPPGSHSITASAGPNGSIDPSGTVVVDDGENQAFAFIPESGYEVDEVLVDGEPASTESPYTFTNVTDDHEISVTFVAAPTEDTLGQCTDGEDNDEDDAIDLDDEDCVSFKPVLTLVKHTTEGNGIFTFDVIGGGEVILLATAQEAQIVTSDGAGTTTVTLNDEGTYSVTEDQQEGWDFDDVDCTYDGESTGSLITYGKEITVDAGDEVTCTFTNSPEEGSTGTLIIQKVVINDNGGTGVATDFAFEVNGDGVAFFEEGGENQLTVAVGTYTVIELAAAGYTTSYENCTEVSVSAEGSATCVITNNDVAPQDGGGGGGNFSPGTSNENDGEVLGESTEGQVLGNTCPLITAYMQRGGGNETNQVITLQSFLNSHLNLTIPVTGEFDLLTELAVNLFQLKYQSEILGPWGLTTPTGYVYKTTMWKINDIACPDLDVPFPQVP